MLVFSLFSMKNKDESLNQNSLPAKTCYTKVGIYILYTHECNLHSEGILAPAGGFKKWFSMAYGHLYLDTVAGYYSS